MGIKMSYITFTGKFCNNLHLCECNSVSTSPFSQVGYIFVMSMFMFPDSYKKRMFLQENVVEKFTIRIDLDIRPL